MVPINVLVSNIGPSYIYRLFVRCKTSRPDLDFDLSRSLKVKTDSAIGLTHIWLLLMFNSNIGPNYRLVYEIGRS